MRLLIPHSVPRTPDADRASREDLRHHRRLQPPGHRRSGAREHGQPIPPRHRARGD